MFIVFPSCYETADLIDGGEKQRNLQFIGKPLDYSRTLCCVNEVIHHSYEDDWSLVIGYITLILVFVVVCSLQGYPRLFCNKQKTLDQCVYK